MNDRNYPSSNERCYECMSKETKIEYMEKLLMNLPIFACKCFKGNSLG